MEVNKRQENNIDTKNLIEELKVKVVFKSIENFANEQDGKKIFDINKEYKDKEALQKLALLKILNDFEFGKENKNSIKVNLILSIDKNSKELKFDMSNSKFDQNMKDIAKNLTIEDKKTKETFVAKVDKCLELVSNIAKAVGDPVISNFIKGIHEGFKAVTKNMPRTKEVDNNKKIDIDFNKKMNEFFKQQDTELKVDFSFKKHIER